MASITPNDLQSGAVPQESGFKFSRQFVFSVLFLAAGALMVMFIPTNMAVDAITGVNFGENMANLVGEEAAVLNVPTVTYGMIVGVLYMVIGAVGVAPTARIKRVKYWLLVVGGVLIIPTVLILAAVNNDFNLAVLLRASMRLATPIILGAMAGIWTERTGVVNIAIEGMMLTGAGIGFVAFTLLARAGMGVGSGQVLSVAIAVLAGGLMALLHAWLSITFKTDQIVSGTVINIMAVGVTSFLRREVLLSSQAGVETLPEMPIPGLSQIPVLGEMLFQGKPIFYAMLLIVPLTHIILFYTKWGLRTRSVGENPHAADTVGVDVIRTRWANVFIGGLIAGLAGAWFSLENTGTFEDGMTNGKGFISLASVIFGNWMPFGAMTGGILFGFAEALGDRFQILNVPVPAEFVQMTPYIITIVVLAGLVGRSTPPKALGEPYEKE
ncbi:MAG: ABC transporter permease [Chloroflexota bacterium]